MNISLFYTIQNLQIDERQLSKFLYFGFCKIWKLATIKISIWCILYGFCLYFKSQISNFYILISPNLENCKYQILYMFVIYTVH